MRDDTFNLSVVFDNVRAIGTLVCHSDSEINRWQVQQAVNEKLHMMICCGEMNQSPKIIVETLASYIRRICPDVQVLIVPSDACVVVCQVPIQQNPDMEN